MCLAIPGKIVKVEGQKVTVEYPRQSGGQAGQTREALAGGELVKPGDFVMVQMGIVIKILTPGEAKASQKSWAN